jgi:hypothetical protein
MALEDASHQLIYYAAGCGDLLQDRRALRSSLECVYDRVRTCHGFSWLRARSHVPMPIPNANCSERRLLEWRRNAVWPFACAIGVCPAVSPARDFYGHQERPVDYCQSKEVNAVIPCESLHDAFSEPQDDSRSPHNAAWQCCPIRPQSLFANENEPAIRAPSRGH